MERLIQSPVIPPLFPVRSIGNHWWRMVEDRMPNARVGVRVLVRRHRQPYHIVSDRVVVTDYITERAPSGWIHVTVVYPEEERTPYAAPYDATNAPGRQAPPPSPAAFPVMAVMPYEFQLTDRVHRACDVSMAGPIRV
jgi:hypothetical protein